jgi:hypothetical protein
LSSNPNDAPGAPDANVSKTAAQPRKRRMAREPKTSVDQTGKSESSPANEKPATKARGQSRIAAVISLLGREQGATLAEIVEATGWLPHTTRAALTGLKKKGHVITKDKRDDVTCYRISKAAP